MPDDKEHIVTDAEMVRRAMDELGFTCDFAELTVNQMSLALMLAARIKRAVDDKLSD